MQGMFVHFNDKARHVVSASGSHGKASDDTVGRRSSVPAIDQSTPTWKGELRSGRQKKRGVTTRAGLMEKQATPPVVRRPSVPENRHQLGKGNCDLSGRQKKGVSQHEWVSWKSKRHHPENRHQLRKGNCNLVGNKRRSRHERVSWKSKRRHRPSSVPDNRHQLGKGNCDLVGKKKGVTTRAGLKGKQATTPSRKIDSASVRPSVRAEKPSIDTTATRERTSQERSKDTHPGTQVDLPGEIR